MSEPIEETTIQVYDEASWPLERCANCGTTDDVAPRQTRLVRVRTKGISPSVGLSGIGLKLRASEQRVQLELPFCRRCRGTAQRLRPTLTQRIVVLGGLALFFFFALIVLATESGVMGDLGALGACGLPLLLAALLSVGWYATRKPRAPATSYYQPVWLKHFDARTVVFGFTNVDYADDFLDANPTAKVN